MPPSGRSRAGVECRASMSERILVGTDGSDTAAQAVSEAVRLAKALGAELHVVTGYKNLHSLRVHDAPEGAVRSYGLGPGDLAQTIVDDAAARARNAGLTTETHLIDADGAEAVLRVAEEIDADLIVVGNQRMSGAGRLLGSVPNTISHEAHCNVLIVATHRS
jgi:nucleotide-binding universal stress UspA family protein